MIEDKCAGAIAFFEREGGKEIKKYLNEGMIQSLSVWQIDRLGRDLRDIMNTIHYFNEKGVCIHFVAQGLSTLDNEGKENAISKLILSILGIVGDMGRKQIRENQMEGIRMAKLKVTYTGRSPHERYKGNEVLYANAQICSKQLQEICVINQACSNLLNTAMERLNLSARAYDRILNVSRTIADLAGSPDIKTEHLAEAIQYRSLDRVSWGS